MVDHLIVRGGGIKSMPLCKLLFNYKLQNMFSYKINIDLRKEIIVEFLLDKDFPAFRTLYQTLR